MHCQVYDHCHDRYALPSDLSADLLRQPEFRGEKPLLYLLQQVEQNNLLDDFLLWSGTNNINPAYESIAANVLPAWGALLLMIVIFTAVSVFALRKIDKDKR